MSISKQEAAINLGHKRKTLEKEVQTTRSGLMDCLKKCQRGDEYRSLARRHEKALRELYTVRVIEQALEAGLLTEGGMVSLG